MSYRTIKRLLGETSLERKCRFLFGSGLLILITGSFYFYARQTTKLVYDQNEIAARLLVAPAILVKHWRWAEGEKEFNLSDLVSKMAEEVKPIDLEKTTWTLSKLDIEDAMKRPYA